MVFCNGCGIEADRKDVYCRICGKIISRPSRFWQMQQRFYSPPGRQPGLEIHTRKVVGKAKENMSPIDSTTTVNPDVALVAQSKEPLAQTEQSQSRDAKMELEPSLKEEGELLVKMREFDKLRPQSRKTRRAPSTIAGYSMVSVGALSLAFSVYSSSTILVFIGLGLAFWGALFLFVRPQKYVRSELLDSTALSSLRTIDRVMTNLGYLEKGIYIPGGNPERAIVFIPSEPFSKIPNAKEIEGELFIKNPKGIAMVPPGLALANLIEKRLGVDLRKCSLEDLSERLPKLLIEDLEMVKDFEMHVDGNQVRFRFDESIYADFCHELSSSTRVCAGLGCPICSAMACVLAIASGKPVSFEGDKTSPDGLTLESSYHILEA